MKIITKLPEIKPGLPDRCKVAAYVRVSSGKDAMLHSLAAQVSYYQNLIRQNPNWELIGVYIDEAFTGTKSNRPDFQKLLDDCKAGHVEKIITKSISRFARNTVMLLQTVRDLKSLGVDVYFEEQNIHSMSGDGELMLSILASYAQEESLSASENVKWRIRQDFQKGKPSNLRIFGYDLLNGRLIINEREADVVRMIFSDYLSGLGKVAITNKLQAMGISTKKNSKWMTSTIHAILRDEKYTGNMILQKTFRNNHMQKVKKHNTGELPKYCVDGSHEAIISQAMFDQVQHEIARREKKHIHRKERPAFSEFTGRVRCGVCGANFQRKVTNASTKYASCKWICSTYHMQGVCGCDMKPLPEQILKQLAADVLNLDVYDETIIRKKISQISVPCFGEVEFVLTSGQKERRSWQYPSRRETWKRKREQAMKG